MSASIKRCPELMYLRFADLPFGTAEEFADNFVADFSADDRVIGLEIDWPDSYRSGSEPQLLAFGVFGAALSEIGWRYNADVVNSEARVVSILHRHVERLIGQGGLDFRVEQGMLCDVHNDKAQLDLAICDAGGNALLCAEVKRHPFDPVKVQDRADLLRKKALPAFPGAIGVCVFIDETGKRRHRTPPVAPGRWIDWPEAKLPGGGHVWAHIAVIPPHDRSYPWLRKGFLGTRGAVNPAEPSPVLC